MSTAASLMTTLPLSVLDAIYSRRAVRDYTHERVGKVTIDELLKAAVHAPSAMNLQPWAFIVIQDPSVLKEISDEAKVLLSKHPHPSTHSEHGQAPFEDPDFDIFYGATTLIVICGKKDGFGPAEDCYLAAENLMLAACGMGLATCPIGFARDVLKTEKYQDKLSIPEEFNPVLPIIIGHPKGLPRPPERHLPRVLKWMK